METERSCQLKSFSSIACKLRFEKNLVNYSNLNKKSSSLYCYNRLLPYTSQLLCFMFNGQFLNHNLSLTTVFFVYSVNDPNVYLGVPNPNVY